MVKQGDAWPIAMKVVQDWGLSVAITYQWGTPPDQPLVRVDLKRLV
jgi:hypothetical protein